jgi:excisionase family DNA binding protein
MKSRPRPLSVGEAAERLQASEAYVRRLLTAQRLFGIKVGRVWGIYEEDLESFQRVRRQPGRPRKTPRQEVEERAARRRITAERAVAGTTSALRKSRR